MRTAAAISITDGKLNAEINTAVANRITSDKRNNKNE
jgi:hypothetical protein